MNQITKTLRLLCRGRKSKLRQFENTNHDIFEIFIFNLTEWAFLNEKLKLNYLNALDF